MNYKTGEDRDQLIEEMDWEVNVEEAGEAILADIPQRLQGSLRRRALQAPTSYPAAVYLKCMDCCAFDRKEVQLCHQEGCPLYPLRTRLFKPRGKAENHDEQVDRAS